MDWTTTGNSERSVPEALRNLPLDLQRSQALRDDPNIPQAAQDYLDGQPTPISMPRKMQFNAYKTPPYNLAWMGNAVALLRALARDAQKRQQLQDIALRDVPIRSFRDAGQQYATMPAPEDIPQPTPVRSGDGVISGYDLDEIERKFREMVAQRSTYRRNVRQSALETIRGRQDQNRAYLNLSNV